MNPNDTHAPLRAFLQEKTVSHLPSVTPPVGGRLGGGRNTDNAIEVRPLPVPPPTGEGIIKAGVIPFIRSKTGLRFYVMKPVSTRPELGEPEFQLCKGTRMQHLPTGWEDIRDPANASGSWETLAETALREGIEELGLKLSNIADIFEAGCHGFSSASTGKGKQMWLFALEMINTHDFLADADIASTTAARRWLSAAKFATIGRKDHWAILHEIEEKLRIT